MNVVRLCSVLVSVCCVAAAGCGPDAPAPSSAPHPRVVTASRLSMGSTLTLTAWTADESGAEAAFDEVFDEFTRLEKVLSTWMPDSDVSRVNHAAGVEAVHTGSELREVLATARQISEWTGGKFDVTFGALSGLWKFDHDQDNSIPDRQAMLARLPLVDYRAIRVNDAAGTVFLARKGMSIHLGGIGKGYAIDRGAAILRVRGFRDFMVQSGGDIYVAGLKDGRPWRLGIQDPRGTANRIFAELDLSDGTFSTSGDYERAFVKNGTRYHHILDPATGEPARGVRSVTIVSRRAILADGLSTGVFILGADKGLALIEKLPDVEGVIVTDRNEVLISSGLRSNVRLVAPLTDAP